MANKTPKPDMRRDRQKLEATGSRVQQVTSHEVAKLAGVSRAAVSRAFTPDASISEAMRKKVMAAANQLGYRPNALARSLITRRSNVIGLIMADWENPFYTALLRGFSERLQSRGYEVMLLTSKEQINVDSVVRRLQQYQVAGIIFVSTSPSPQVAAECKKAGMRNVIINREARDLPIKSVVCDHQLIGEDIGHAVMASGYTRFALLRGNPDVDSGIIRTKAIRDTLSSNKDGKIVADKTGVMGYDAGRAAIRELMQQNDKPDVVICSSDLTAMGVLDGARNDLDIAVPRKLGIMGFGDAPLAHLARYELSTVRLPIETIIDAAVATVLAPVDDDRLGVFNAELIFRSTLRKQR